MTVTGASRRYLETARDCGLLGTTDGFRYVAGWRTEPLSGERQVVVEYAELPPDPELSAQLLADVLRDQPPSDTVVVRTGPGAGLPAPWLPHLTYITLDTVLPPVPGVEITRASADDAGRVRQWLLEAFRNGAADQGRRLREEAAQEATDALMADPARISLLASTGPEPAGHVTLTRFEDEVTGAVFVELIDLLVDTGYPGDASACRHALTAAASVVAAEAGLPLLGNVVHHPDGGNQVVDRLTAGGWVVDHVYWIAPAPARSGP